MYKEEETRKKDKPVDKPLEYVEVPAADDDFVDDVGEEMTVVGILPDGSPTKKDSDEST